MAEYVDLFIPMITIYPSTSAQPPVRYLEQLSVSIGRQKQGVSCDAVNVNQVEQSKAEQSGDIYLDVIIP